MTAPLALAPFISADTIPDGAVFLDQVRALNAAGVEIPWAWGLTTTRLDIHAEDQAMLVFGVHNDVGALHWDDGESSQVPAGGSNPEWRGYFLAGSHETGIPPRAEVPIETVYEAVAEFLATGRRPTCVRWQEAASPLSQFE